MTSLSSKADRAPRVRGAVNTTATQKYLVIILDIFLMITLNRAKKKHMTAFVAVQLRQAKALIAAVEVCKLTTSCVEYTNVPSPIASNRNRTLVYLKPTPLAHERQIRARK